MDGDARDEAKPRRERPRQRRASERTEPRRRRREEEQEDAATQREEPRPAREQPPQLEAAEAAKLAVDHVTALTGRDPEGVTSLEPTDDGWLVGVEVVESRRVPDSTDVLAVYEAAVDHGGRLVSYRRVDRYARGRGNER